MIHFALFGDYERTPDLKRFAEGIQQEMEKHGFQRVPTDFPQLQLVLNFVDPNRPKPFRRKGNGTFVVSITEVDEPVSNILKTGYPILIRSLGNLMIFIDRSRPVSSTHFITLEQGCYAVSRPEEDDQYFQEVFERLRPLATSRLVINNIFHPDLPEDLWEGDETSESISRAGKKLDEMNLLPAPFPIQELLPPREFRHIKRLYGIGGLSYGNLSARRDKNEFWMSASGVNKGNLSRIGKDILLVKGYDEDQSAMELSVPSNIKPNRVSVDAIEHWMIYNEHPEVGAIVHIHAWMEGVPSTEINYPCGTVQLAEAVAGLIREAEDPSRAVIGLKNHGLTITGRDIDDIFERIEGKIIPQVPMS